MNCCGYPKRLGYQVFADHRGMVYDFSKVKPYLSTDHWGKIDAMMDDPQEKSVFDITPPQVDIWAKKWEGNDSDDSAGVKNADNSDDNNNGSRSDNSKDQDAENDSCMSLGYALSKRQFPFSTWLDKRFKCPNSETCPFKEFDYIGSFDDSTTLLRTWREDIGPQEAKYNKPFTPWGRSKRKNFVEHPPVTLATILFVWLHICGDLKGMVAFFFRAADAVSRDVRKANMERLFHFSVFDDILEVCQEAIFLEACITTSSNFRAISHILVNRICERSTPDISPEGIDEKLQFLFSDMPRVQEGNVRFYGIRCGLVYGSMAAYECEMRDKRTRWYQKGSAAVTGASTTIANIPSVNGVPVGSLVEPVATGIRGVVLDSLGRREKRLGAGVGLVEYRFLTQVIGEANQGLLASYRGDNVDRDLVGNPIPPYSPEQMVCFKEAAWEVFKLVMHDENRQIGIHLPREVLEMRPGIRHLTFRTRKKRRMYPLISSDLMLGDTPPNTDSGGNDGPSCFPLDVGINSDAPSDSDGPLHSKSLDSHFKGKSQTHVDAGLNGCGPAKPGITTGTFPPTPSPSASSANFLSQIDI